MDPDRAPHGRDEELMHDTQRGERSQAGRGDADEQRNPIPPATEGESAEQDPASGRGRDPELGEAGL